MKVIKTSVVIKALLKDGWYLARQKGSHRQFKHPVKSGTVTVNGSPSSDIYGAELASVQSQSGLKF